MGWYATLSWPAMSAMRSPAWMTSRFSASRRIARSYTRHWSMPASLARDSAQSALPMSVDDAPTICLMAIPTPAVTLSSRPSTSISAPSTVRMTSAAAVASAGMESAGRTTANSSPPFRETIAPGNAFDRRLATSRITASPAGTPMPSLMSLKSSMSTRSSDPGPCSFKASALRCSMSAERPGSPVSGSCWAMNSRRSSA